MWNNTFIKSQLTVREFSEYGVICQGVRYRQRQPRSGQLNWTQVIAPGECVDKGRTIKPDHLYAANEAAATSPSGTI